MEYCNVHTDSVGLLPESIIKNIFKNYYFIHTEQYLNIVNRVATYMTEVKCKKLFKERLVTVDSFSQNITIPFFPILKVEKFVVNGNDCKYSENFDLTEKSHWQIVYRSFTPYNEIVELAVINQMKELLQDQSFPINHFI